VTDIVGSTIAVEVVRSLDVVTAHACCFAADALDARGELLLSNVRVRVVICAVAAGCNAAESNLVLASAEHVVGEFGVRVDGVVVRFDAVGVVDGKLWVILFLRDGVDDAVDYTQRVEVELVAWLGSILDLLVFIVKVAVEGWAVVAAVRLGEEIEVP
jgi:hypothetical protein